MARKVKEEKLELVNSMNASWSNTRKIRVSKSRTQNLVSVEQYVSQLYIMFLSLEVKISGSIK